MFNNSNSPPTPIAHQVGYHVRLDAAATHSTRLLFCTTGILLRRLAGDPLLSSTTHVVVDEVHERTLQGDFLLALLRTLVPKRRAMGFPLKVLVMSATMDADLLQSYFGGCPVLSAAGRTFPVEHLFLEDAYEAVGYRLDADAPVALRGGGQSAARALRGAVSDAQQGVVWVCGGVWWCVVVSGVYILYALDMPIVHTHTLDDIALKKTKKTCCEAFLDTGTLPCMHYLHRPAGETMRQTASLSTRTMTRPTTKDNTHAPPVQVWLWWTKLALITTYSSS